MNTPRRVAILGGNRIPFARSNTVYSQASNQEMLTATLQGLVDRFNLDTANYELVIWFNGRPDTVRPSALVLENRIYRLHPILRKSVDKVVRQASYMPEGGSFFIPPLTAAVFVLPRR